VSVEYANIYRMWFFVSQVGRGFEAYAVALDGAISNDIRVVENRSALLSSGACFPPVDSGLRLTISVHHSS
jgi:hypothetical protein